MLHNKKGAALLQVLLVSAVLAGMATMLLRAGLSRTSNARRTRREVAAQLLISRCQMEVDALWNGKTSDAFIRDFKDCCLTCSANNSDNTTCTGCGREHRCTYPISEAGGDPLATGSYYVDAQFADTPENGQCRVTYTLSDSLGGREVRL